MMETVGECNDRDREMRARRPPTQNLFLPFILLEWSLSGSVSVCQVLSHGGALAVCKYCQEYNTIEYQRID